MTSDTLNIDDAKEKTVLRLRRLVSTKWEIASLSLRMFGMIAMFRTLSTFCLRLRNFQQEKNFQSLNAVHSF